MKPKNPKKSLYHFTLTNIFWCFPCNFGISVHFWDSRSLSGFPAFSRFKISRCSKQCLNRMAPHFYLPFWIFRSSYGPEDRLLILVSFASLCLPDRSSTVLYAVCTYVLVVHYISHTKGPGSIQSPVCIPPQSLIVVFAKVDR